MPKVRASSGTIGTTSLPMSSSRSSLASIRTNAIVVETLRPSVPSWNSSKSVAEGLALAGAPSDPARFGTEAAQRLAALAQVRDLGGLSSAGR